MKLKVFENFHRINTFLVEQNSAIEVFDGVAIKQPVILRFLRKHTKKCVNGSLVQERYNLGLQNSWLAAKTDSGSLSSLPDRGQEERIDQCSTFTGERLATLHKTTAGSNIGTWVLKVCAPFSSGKKKKTAFVSYIIDFQINKLMDIICFVVISSCRELNLYEYIHNWWWTAVVQRPEMGRSTCSPSVGNFLYISRRFLFKLVFNLYVIFFWSLFIN